MIAGGGGGPEGGAPAFQSNCEEGYVRVMSTHHVVATTVSNSHMPRKNTNLEELLKVLERRAGDHLLVHLVQLAKAVLQGERQQACNSRSATRTCKDSRQHNNIWCTANAKRCRYANDSQLLWVLGYMGAVDSRSCDEEGAMGGGGPPEGGPTLGLAAIVGGGGGPDGGAPGEKTNRNTRVSLGTQAMHRRIV